MHRLLRYLLALLVATGATLGVAIEHDSLILFTGTFVTYAITVALWLRYPSLLQVRWAKRGDYNVASGVVSGGATFGTLTLALGIGESIHLGAAIMGYGLVMLGLIGGIWMVDSGEITFSPSDSDVTTSDSPD